MATILLHCIVGNVGNKVGQIQQRAECAGKEHQQVKQDG